MTKPTASLEKGAIVMMKNQIIINDKKEKL